MQSLSSLQQIRLEVERRVALAIVPVLFDKLTRYHARRKWRHCACDYCITKKRAGFVIENARRDNRDRLRFAFSQKLKQLIDE